VCKTRIEDVHELRETRTRCGRMGKLDQRITDSAVVAERDFELVWLQEEDSLNVKTSTFLGANVLSCYSWKELHYKNIL